MKRVIEILTTDFGGVSTGVDESVWSDWWRIKNLFAIWSSPVGWLFSPGARTAFGNDFLTGLRRNASTARAFDLLDQTPQSFARLQAMAMLNQSRHEQMFGFVALIYVSVPVTVLLGLSEIAPDGVLELYRNWKLGFWIAVGALTFGAIYYYAGVWRAKQIVSVLELWRIERGELRPLASASKPAGADQAGSGTRSAAA